MLRKCIVLAVILTIIFSLSACDLLPTKAPTEPGTPGTTPTTTEESKGIKMLARKLIAEYEINEIAADHKYKNHILIIVGSVADIGRDPSINKAYISVEDGKYDYSKWLRCFFNNENELLEVVKDQEVIVKGKCVGKKKDEEGTSFPILLENCSLVEETEFQMLEWKVNVESKRPRLDIRFKKFGYSLTFTLINPNGEETSEIAWYYLQGTGEWKDEPLTISLTKEENENPIPGQYKLIVEDVKGNVVATESFNFSGPDPEVKVTEVSGHWEHDIVSKKYNAYKHEYEPVYGKECHYSFTFTIDVKNGGDLPFYFQSIIVKSPNDDFVEGSYEYGAALAPNEEKAVSLSTEYYRQYKTLSMQGYVYMQAEPKSLYFRSPGEKILTLEFCDGTGKAVYSMNTTITIPAKPPAE